MDLNFLQQLLGGGSANAAPAPAPQPTGDLSPEWFASAMASPEATAPVPQQPAGMPTDLLQGTPYGASEQVNAMQAAAAPPQPVPMASPALEAPKRERRSILDTIGRISDVLAKVGGADALYQPTLDARQDRGFAIDDRGRAVEMDNLKLQKAGQDVETEPRARMASALAAVADVQNPAEIWPSIAEQAGIPPQQAAAIGRQLATNPRSAGMLAKALGYVPATAGSLPASIQNYALHQKILAEQGPKAAEEFMRFAQPEMAAMRPYQEAQLARDDRKFDYEARRGAREESRDERKLRIDEEAAAAKIAGGEGSDLTPTQRGVVTQKLKTLPVVRAQLKRAQELYAQMKEEGTLGRGRLGGLLPGAIAGGTAEKFDKAVGALRKSMLSLTRTPGVGSMSDYETALDEQMLPSRWGSDEGRSEALEGIDALVTGLEKGYGEMIPKKRAAPAARGGASPLPRTLKQGTVVKGHRYLGGDRTDKKNWEKVQ